MPDVRNFTVEQNGTRTLNNFPRFTISGQITDSVTGALLFDYTGANAIEFPNDMGTIFSTAAARREFVREFAHYLMLKKAGLAS